MTREKQYRTEPLPAPAPRSDAHRERADEHATDAADRLFDLLANTPTSLLSGMSAESSDVDPAYDPESWPLVVVDRDGLRYEVEVDIHVRMLGTPAEEQAKRDELRAALTAKPARGGASDE